MMAQRQKLPAFFQREDVVNTIRDNQVERLGAAAVEQMNATGAIVLFLSLSPCDENLPRSRLQRCVLGRGKTALGGFRR